MSHNFEGKVAIITGSTQGLGEAITRLFLKRGAHGVIICGRNKVHGHRLEQELSKEQKKVKYVEADLSKSADCEKVVKTADKTFGKVDILVNTAGLTERGTIRDTTSDHFDRFMAVNVRAPFILIRESIAIMTREGISGTIVNIGSVASYGSVPDLCPYAVSKGALNVLTKNVAYSVMRDRIRINTLNIGWMDTPGEDEIQRRYHNAQDDWLQKAEKEMPFGRILKPEEVAKAVAFLASDESGMMTGALIDFDQSVQGAGMQPVPPQK